MTLHVPMPAGKDAIDSSHPHDTAQPAYQVPVQQEALEWLVIFWSGEITDKEFAAWQRWCTTSPEHALAWQQVQQMGQKLHGVPAGIAGDVLRAPPESRRRRKIVQALGVVLMSGGTTYAVRRTAAWQSYMADYATATGEQRQLVLADATQIHLNTGSAIDVLFDAQQRRIVLRQGEILITTAPDTAAVHRPFTVETRQGMVRALGTRFMVRQNDGRSIVAVFQGAVEIQPGGDGAPLRLEAAQQVGFNDAAVDVPQVLDGNAIAWINGSIVAERMRLADFLAELSRYRPGFIRCDDKVAEQIVSGVYPLRDTDRIL